MAEIVHLTHDAGTWAEYTISGADGGRVAITPAAGMNGTANGVEMDMDGSPNTGGGRTELFASDPPATSYRLGFYFNLNDTSVTSGASVDSIVVLDPVSNDFVIISLNNGGSGEFLRAELTEDDGVTLHEVDSAPFGSGAFTCEIQIDKASGVSANDGVLTIYINGIQVDQVTGIDIFNQFADLRDLVVSQVESGGAVTGSFYIDEIIFRDDSTPIYPSDEGSYIIGTAIDNETDGTTAFLTAWRDSNLYLQRWDLPTLTKEEEITLGAATLAQVQARTKVAYPYAGSVSQMWIFGNMDDPAYVTGTVHLIETSSGGASGSWTISPDLSSWNSNDVLDSLFVTPDLDGIGTRQFTAIRRQTSAPPELWQGLNALSLVSALPFPSGASVEYRGMHMGQNREISVGIASIGTGTNRIVSAADPYTTWSDITNNYPSGTVEVLRYL